MTRSTTATKIILFAVPWFSLYLLILGMPGLALAVAGCLVAGAIGWARRDELGPQWALWPLTMALFFAYGLAIRL